MSFVKADLEKIKSNSRKLDSQDDKKNDYDFALWKKADKKHLMKWQSPWSIGFPGWHLECTAMSNKYLGEEFDIHGGGIDLKFPHHDCEIAQAVGYNGKQPAKFWIHTNMLTLNGKKMSKSTGNNILPNEIFSKLKNLKPSKGGEIHITDAIQLLINDNEKFIAHNFAGKYLDCGSMEGYINSSKEIAKL